MTKTYLDHVANIFSESMGWGEISPFVKTFIEEHPKPEPLPKLLDKIDVKPVWNRSMGNLWTTRLDTIS